MPSRIPRNFFDALYAVSHHRVDAVAAGVAANQFWNVNLNRFEALPTGTMDALTSLSQLCVVVETQPVDRSIPASPIIQTTFLLQYIHATEMCLKLGEQRSLLMRGIFRVHEW